MVVHRMLYWSLLLVLAASMTTSVFLSNLAWVLMGVNWLVEGDWRCKWMRLRKSRLLQAFLVLMAVHVLWLVGNDDVWLGLDDIRKKLPLLVLPLVVLTSKPLSRRQLGWIVAVYLATVAVLTVVGVVRFVSIADLSYRSVVPTVSHIRFGLNVCFSVCLVFYLLVSWRTHQRKGGAVDVRRWRWLLFFALLWLVWCLFFLFLLQSYTSFFILLVLLLVLPWMVPSCRSRLRLCLFGGVIVFVAGMVCVVVGFVNDYYGDCCRNGDKVESGGYIYRNVDALSMAAGWRQVSDVSIEAYTDNGYSIYSTLVRYLNASHRSKDSLGVASLSDADVAAVKRGVANPVYLFHPSFRKMAYMALFEYESYRCGEVKDFSMLERLALWRNAWQVFVQHPLLGVGTGDMMPTCRQQLQKDGVLLIDNSKTPHNQYLSFLVAFGILGMVLILFFFIRAVSTTPSLRTPLAWAYLIIVLLSFVSENTLDTLAGCLFAVLPLLMFTQVSIEEVKGKGECGKWKREKERKKTLTPNPLPPNL